MKYENSKWTHGLGSPDYSKNWVYTFGPKVGGVGVKDIEDVFAEHDLKGAILEGADSSWYQPHALKFIDWVKNGESYHSIQQRLLEVFSSPPGQNDATPDAQIVALAKALWTRVGNALPT